MTLADLADRLTRAERLYRAACEGAILAGPGRGRRAGGARLVWPLPEDSDTREALRLRVRELERAVAAEQVRHAIQYAKGAGRRAR